MLKQLRLQNFKCYNDTTVDFSNLTVFSGANGAGKSTIIQALLLFRQIVYSGYYHYTTPTVNLNGSLVYLGNSFDVLNKWHPEKKECYFTISTPRNKKIELGLQAIDGKEIRRRMNLLTPYEIDKVQKDKNHINLFNDFFIYLSAERIGPRISFDVPNEWPRINFIGNNGENSAYQLSQIANIPVKQQYNSFLKHLKGDDEDIENILNYLQKCYSILGKEIEINPIYFEYPEKVSLDFSIIDKQTKVHKSFRPLNVGFGLTYTLPIFISLIYASTFNDIMVIIENPEAHLHPKGQVSIGRMIAWAAAAGIQVIIETHSDHVLNGIRLAVKNKEIRPEEVQLNFIVNDDNEDGAQIVSPKIMSDGMIDKWPEGFFDEYNKALIDLF